MNACGIGLVLVELRFKVHRGLVAERAVAPFPLVKDFDPLEDRGPRLGARGRPTPIGDWFYHGGRKYRLLKWTVHMLVDVVSKNGNLLMLVVYSLSTAAKLTHSIRLEDLPAELPGASTR